MNRGDSSRREAEHNMRFKNVSNGLICGLALIAAFFLITEHWAHVSPLLPYALLLVCPLMHWFLHRHHGRSSHHHDSTTQKSAGRSGSDEAGREPR